MKKFFLFFIFSLFLGNNVLAEFPNDAITYSFNSINNTSCTSSDSVLLSPVNWDRTILNNKIISRQAGDNHIGDSSRAYPNNYLLDCELGQSNCETNTSWVLPANNYLFCSKTSTNDHTYFQVTYVDRNLNDIKPIDKGIDFSVSLLLGILIFAIIEYIIKLFRKK